MMSPDNFTNKKESGTSRKAATTTRPVELQDLKCPRCDSPNTKFCYYNNYSHTQPRHFCKTCRRYWTKGGALRNIPIGGGCRKNKKICSKSSNFSTFSSGTGDSKDSAGSSPYFSDIGGLKFFNGMSPGMDFQLGGLGLNNNNFSRILHSSSNTTGASNSYNQHHDQLISSFGEMISTSISCFGIDPSGNSSGTNNLMGFNFALPSSVLKQDHGNGAGGIFLQDHNTTNSNLASSIESLSSINQDLHWKLQQERLAILFDDQNQAPQKPQPILFHNLDSSKPDAVVGNSRKDNNNNNSNGSIGIGPTGNLATEWFFGSSNYSAAVNSTPTNSSSTGNGIQAWSNFNQYTPLP